MKNTIYTIVLILVSMSGYSQVSGTYKISNYSVNLAEEFKDPKDPLKSSIFKGFIQNDEAISFNKDKSITAASLKKFYNPRFLINEDNEFVIYFGETKEKESFSRFTISIQGNSFVLTKETPALTESYTFAKN